MRGWGALARWAPFFDDGGNSPSPWNGAPNGTFGQLGQANTWTAEQDIRSNSTYQFTVGDPTGTPYADPTVAPTVVANGAGVLTGAYTYAYSWSAPIGETKVSPISGTFNASAQQVTITVPMIPRGMTQGYLYRYKAGVIQGLVFSWGSGNDHYATTLHDNVADGSIGAKQPNLANTTQFVQFALLGSHFQYVCCAPGDPGSNDLTVLTADPSTSGSLGIDIYGAGRFRAQPNASALVLSALTNGWIFQAYHLSQDTDGTGPATNVKTAQLLERGSLQLLTDSGADAIVANMTTNGGGRGLYVTVNSTVPGIQIDNSGASNDAMTINQSGTSGGKGLRIVATGSGSGSRGLFVDGSSANMVSQYAVEVDGRNRAALFFAGTNSSGVEVLRVQQGGVGTGPVFQVLNGGTGPAIDLSNDGTAGNMNIALGTVNGTRIGTAGGAAGQKLGFFNATPIVQPLLATGAAHTVDDVITTLQSLGLVRQS